jgi:hypothetical protein|tara:strand:- start:384 stop:884 length:501 start_codon:yes stop_codon:yes gene_type:complete
MQFLKVLAFTLVAMSPRAMCNVFFKPLDVSELEVITPSKIEFTIIGDEQYNNSTLVMKIQDVDFSTAENLDCTVGNNKECSQLLSHLNLKSITIELMTYDHESQLFTGNIFVNGSKLSHTMIREGWYKFDYRKSRSKHLVILQKDAMCKGLGIWRGKSTSLDYLCN